jgi:hypothetical protein
MTANSDLGRGELDDGRMRYSLMVPGAPYVTVIFWVAAAFLDEMKGNMVIA